MIGRYLILLLGCSYVFMTCQKDKEHVHAAKDHAHASGDHTHEGHEHDDSAEGKDSAGKSEVDAASIAQTIEAGCAMCIYKMEGVEKCSLALKIDGKPYLVEGASIFDHGDAHAADGLCKSARQAVVKGKIENGKFVATQFELKPKTE